MDREKVIERLEYCITNQTTGFAELGCSHDGCKISSECVIDMMHDVLTLLKVQEPRVISWQDAESMRLCWVETRFPHTISPADIMHYFAESPNITVFKIHQDTRDWPINEYGIKWRCWNNEPTNEQMEATPWNT